MKMELDITKIVEEIAMQAKENQEEFIFETIQPYCENILQMKINKEELKQILLNGMQKQQPCEDCISMATLIRKLNAWDSKAYAIPNYVWKVIRELPSVTPSYNSVKSELKQPCEEEEPNCTECRYYDKEKHYCPRFCKVIENTIAEITSEQTRWIPVSESDRPENMEKCITTMKYEVSYAPPWEVVQENMWIDENDGDAHFEQDDENVIAWMPLPEPYKAEYEVVNLGNGVFEKRYKTESEDNER